MRIDVTFDICPTRGPLQRQSVSPVKRLTRRYSTCVVWSVALAHGGSFSPEPRNVCRPDATNIRHPEHWTPKGHRSYPKHWHWCSTHIKHVDTQTTGIGKPT